MSAHVHAASMALYAQDAAETETPWKRWRARRTGTNDWIRCDFQPSWDDVFEYERIPSFIKVNGIEVPEPVRQELACGDEYFVACPSAENLFLGYRCGQTGTDLLNLSRGLVHRTRASAQWHARAMLAPSLSPDNAAYGAPVIK